VDGSEDRGIPRPAGESRICRINHEGALARLLQLPWLVRPAHGARSVDGHGAGRVGRRAGARGRELRTERDHQRDADAFDYLKEQERGGERYDTIVLDPPAFAKTRGALPAALRGYKEINLRAMRLLTRGGMLFTASCSFHLQKPLFLEMLQAAAADSGRRLALRAVRGQPSDHPEILTIPETAYIKGALIEALD
jgi:hypothetical protein